MPEPSPPAGFIYRRLLGHFGPQGWWPGESPDEIAAGAILIQSVAWPNARRAVRSLGEATGFDWRRLAGMPHADLAALLRPARFFNQKAGRLRALACLVVDAADGSLPRLLAGDLPTVRTRLLALPGIGKETADAILVYAGGAALFVVDAYARRIFSRLGWPAMTDDKLRETVQAELSGPVELSEFHALIDALGSRICRPAPACPACPVRSVCAFAVRATLQAGGDRPSPRRKGNPSAHQGRRKSVRRQETG